MKLNDIVQCVITGFGDQWVYVKILPDYQPSVIYKSNIRFIKYDEDGNYIEVEDQFKRSDILTAMVDKVFSTGKCRLSVTRMLESPGRIFRSLYTIGDTFQNSVVIKISDGYVTVLANGQFKLSLLDDGSLNVGDKIDKIKVISLDKNIIVEREGNK